MTNIPQNAVVWAEIPVTDLEKSAKFYGEVLQAELVEEKVGTDTIMVFASDKMGVSGHLHVGKPAPAGTGNTINLSVPDSVEDGVKRVEAAGGKTVSPIVEIPAGRFCYFQDLDGNSFGLFTFSH